MDADVDRSHTPQVEGVRLHVRRLLINFAQQRKKKRLDRACTFFRVSAGLLRDAPGRYAGAVCAPGDLQTAAALALADQW